MSQNCSKCGSVINPAGSGFGTCRICWQEEEDRRLQVEQQRRYALQVEGERENVRLRAKAERLDNLKGVVAIVIFGFAVKMGWSWLRGPAEVSKERIEAPASAKSESPSEKSAREDAENKLRHLPKNPVQEAPSRSISTGQTENRPTTPSQPQPEIQPQVNQTFEPLTTGPQTPESQPEPQILKSLEGVPLPCTLIVTEQTSLLNIAGKETAIPVGTTIKVLTRKSLGSLGAEIKGAQFVGNESRLAGKVKLSNSPKPTGNSPKASGFSTVAQIDARLGELQKSYDEQMANVNRLTNFRRKPVQKGTLAYDSLMEADAILRQVTTEAKTLKEKKSQMTGGAK